MLTCTPTDLYRTVWVTYEVPHNDCYYAYDLNVVDLYIVLHCNGKNSKDCSCNFEKILSLYSTHSVPIGGRSLELLGKATGSNKASLLAMLQQHLFGEEQKRITKCASLISRHRSLSLSAADELPVFHELFNNSLEAAILREAKENYARIIAGTIVKSFFAAQPGRQFHSFIALKKYASNNPSSRSAAALRSAQQGTSPDVVNPLLENMDTIAAYLDNNKELANEKVYTSMRYAYDLLRPSRQDDPTIITEAQVVDVEWNNVEPSAPPAPQPDEDSVCKKIGGDYTDRPSTVSASIPTSGNVAVFTEANNESSSENVSNASNNLGSKVAASTKGAIQEGSMNTMPTVAVGKLSITPPLKPSAPQKKIKAHKQKSYLKQ